MVSDRDSQSISTKIHANNKVSLCLLQEREEKLFLSEERHDRYIR